MKPRKPNAKERAALSPIKNIKWNGFAVRAIAKCGPFVLIAAAVAAIAHRSVIRKVSTKRAAQLREYSKKRKIFLAEPQNQFCAAWLILSGQKIPTTEVHHIRGRIGELLNDERYWMAVSREAHDWIHSRPSQARKKGWLK